MRGHLMLLAAVLSSAAFASPCTKTVPPGGDVQTAVNSAVRGDVICLRGGTYAQNNVWVAASGITITAYPGESPVLDGAGLLGPAWATFFTLSGSNITLSGIEIKNGVSPGAKGIWLRGNNNTVRNVRVDNVQDQGILVTGHNALVEGNTVSRAAMSNKDCALCRPARWAFGIGSYLDYTTANTVKGIQTFQSDSALVENNIVYDNFSTNYYLVATSGTIMRNNIAFNTKNNSIGARAAGLTLADEQPIMPLSSGNRVVGNMFMYADVSAYAWTSINGSGLRDAIFEGNTLINSAIKTGAWNVTHVNSQIRNNLFYRNDGGSTGAVRSATGISFAENVWCPTRPENVPGANELMCQ